MNASISGRVGGDEDEGAFARVARPLGAEATTGNLKVKIRERKKKEKKNGDERKEVEEERKAKKQEKKRGQRRNEEREERNDACRKGRLEALRGSSQRVEEKKKRSSDVHTGHNSRIMRRFIRAYVSEP